MLPYYGFWFTFKVNQWCYSDIDPTHSTCDKNVSYQSDMEITNKKKFVKRESRKTIGGIKLPPIEPVSNEIKTILDVDPDFYSLVQGRPIRPNTSINKYKQDIKEVALKRALNGFLVDEIIRIDREIETERTIFETASKHFDECQHSFDKFLAYDNNKTIDVMKKSDSLSKDLANQTEEHKKANYDLASIKSKLQYIDESLLILLSFENFLHKAAPILWQESENVKLDAKQNEIISMDSDIYHKVDINLVKERLNQLSPPRLYFKTPEQLLIIFDLLQKQNLNYLLVTEELNCEKNKFLKARDLLKDMLRLELDFIRRKVLYIVLIVGLCFKHRHSYLVGIFLITKWFIFADTGN